ncbi:ATP-binding protein [uncultured Clostridium sp.]|uniref:ATP-binding protein n=1 Tax=uncultured Clostridium sp. TaxID=59620 RepID=UPI0025FD866D|nr:ATP-binding protein [uncultured Clostridium sp.]
MRKKKTILRMFLIPLSFVMLLQALVALGAVHVGGTVRHLEEYSVGIMEQIVKNRNLILSNNMTHQWTDISGEYEIANSSLERILEEKQLTLHGFMEDEEAKEELLNQMLLPSLDIIRRNGVNGVYLILADGLGKAQEEEGEEVYKCSGIYFRDADPYVNPKDYSDLLMERGNYEFSHDLGIPFDTSWTSRFLFRQEGQLEADSFFYKPYRAALVNPGAKEDNLAYWSSTFYLENDRAKDSYSMISYSVPLMCDGKVYGVMGIEISSAVINGLLPYSELNAGEHSGYLIAKYTDEGELLPFFLSGNTLKRNLDENIPLNLKETQYTGLYQIDGLEDGRNYYAEAVAFPMYSPNTPFVENGWVLFGVQSEDSLFGMGSRITRNIALAVLISLIVGIICIYFLMHYLTRPITQLADWIRDVRKEGPRNRGKSDIAEIKALYDAVWDLTEKQKKAEAEALEEKERYLLALQSSTDIIYTYNVEGNSIEIYNLLADGKKSGHGSYIENLIEGIQQSKLLYDADRQLMKKMFLRLDDKFEMDFRALTQSGGWQWMELSGKTICDASGKKSKVIGSIRNIQEQKEKEQMESKAVRIDPVTGLYREKVGQKIIRAEVELGRPGFMLLMDLDKFQEMNDHFGIEFGDAVLEEMGIFILKQRRENEKSGKRLIAVRAGGDEILVWFRGFSRGEIPDFFGRMNHMLSNLCSEDLEISVTAAVIALGGGAGSYTDYAEKLRAALAYGKRRRKSQLTFCEDVPESECTEKRDYNEIASNGNVRALNMVTRVFNLFDRGGRVGPIVSVLFAKMGTNYNASDILMADIRWDFNASGVYRQWHRNEDAVADTTVCHFKNPDFERCLTRFASGYVRFSENGPFTEEERRILHISDGVSGVCIPMYDGGKLMGAINFIRKAEQRQWSDGECSELQEVVKIIETNINRERYDLASRAKSDFLSRMSHEIRTPMNAIIGMTAIAMEREEKKEEIGDCLIKIDQSSQYLLSLINDILDMSKIESGKMKLACDSGSIIKLADEIGDLMENQMLRKNIAYIRDVQVEHPWVYADLMRLKQVIINLLSNAVKFTGEGGRIKFSVSERQTGSVHPGENAEVEICFAVEDNGIGISPENRERIFNAFEQAEDYTAAVYGGTGLGLSISSRLVRMMGGEIELESREGRGSRFSFVLRFNVSEEPEEAFSAEPEAAAYDFSGCRILLVEDNELNTEIAKTLLEMHGFTVDTAANGREGVEKFAGAAEGAYSLILMDIRMPVMDGLEATREIRRMSRADAQSIPIIAMTANAFDEDMRKSIKSGMNGHLAKPVDVKELLSAVKNVLK